MSLSLLPLLLDLMLFASCYAAIHHRQTNKKPYADTKCATVYKEKGYNPGMLDLAPEQVISNMDNMEGWGDKVSSIR